MKLCFTGWWEEAFLLTAAPNCMKFGMEVGLVLGRFTAWL